MILLFRTIRLTLLSVGLLCFLPLSLYAQNPSSAQNSSADLDKRLVSIVQYITQDQIQQANQEVDRLIKDYPNFRLGHLIKGDLILMRTKPVTPLSGDGHYSEKERQELRSEAIARIGASRQKIPSGYVPSNLLLISPKVKHVIAIDTGKSRFYLLEQLANQEFRVVTDYYMSIGKAGAAKERQGDNKTPVGIYDITSFIPGAKLPDYYGPGAFPLNYPNAWDRRNKRDGYGIWIHGTPSNTWSRPPLASEGCVVLPNVDFLALKPYVEFRNTPVIISPKLEWLSKEKIAAERQKFMSTLKQWQTDLESLNMDRYLSHYSIQFSADGQNHKSWSASKRKINAAKTWIKLDLTNLTLFRNPGKEDIMIVTFDQDYKSSNLTNKMRKRQYWALENGQWKILYEGAAT